MTCRAQGALTYEDAHKVASRISTSALVKTALFGEDAKCVFNSLWYRIRLRLTVLFTQLGAYSRSYGFSTTLGTH